MLAAALATAPALAAGDPREGDIDAITLGTRAADISPSAYGHLACGTDGGPPAATLATFADFADCPADRATGLHEVYFEFDDEMEYRARAYENKDMIEYYAGTRLAGHPVILSLLFDDDGVVRAIRMVTDPRAGEAAREIAFRFGERIRDRYGEDGWTCEDLPLAAGETPFGGRSVKQRCEKLYNGDRVVQVAVDYYRRPGQRPAAEAGARFDPSEFVSRARVEILSPELAGQ
jgi:hypothetical protein